MTSLEERRRLLADAGMKLMKVQNSLQIARTTDIVPVLVAMMNFMHTMMEEAEANALVNLLKRNGMAR